MHSLSLKGVVILSMLAGYCVTVATAAPPVKDDPHAGVTQNWDKVLPTDQRFTVLPAFNNEAVRDNETGLVWEKSPDTTATPWSNARYTCINKNVGGRKGWRLPSIPELMSLIDPTQTTPSLPSGHPFLNIQSSNYWSATDHGVNPDVAWNALFHNGTANDGLGKALPCNVWCVRGPMNADTY